MAAASGIKPARLHESLFDVQIDTTLHRFKSRSSSGFPVHGVRFNRTLLGRAMWQFTISAGRAGLRSRSIHAILILGALLVGVAYLAASFSPRQPQTVALDVGLSGLRITLVLFSLFWVQELVAREIERRTVLFALTYPVARGHYIVGRYLGVLGLVALAAVLLGMLLWLVVLTLGKGYAQGFPIAPGFPYWSAVAGLWVDAAVVTAFALWVATFSTVPMLPLALGLAFAVAGKSLGAVVEYLAKGADGDLNLMRLAPVIDAIQWVLPDLSRLDWRNWPMYGLTPDAQAVGLGLILAASYATVLLTLAVMTFNRRDFE
jgi:ABC-type transport system involved in multi-copper enzyme maturation permease subunit